MEIKFNGINISESEVDQFTAMTDEGIKIGDVFFIPRHDYLDVYHTEVEDVWLGQGMAGKMTQAVLELARKYNRKVYPRCPYMLRYLTKHPEYKDVIYA